MALFVVAASAGAASADAGLFLYPRAVMRDGVLTVSDIALIDADVETAARIGAVPVPGAALSDGYLDRREIAEIMTEGGFGTVRVYGSGVRVVPDEPAKGRGNGDKAAVIRKGKSVLFRVIHGRVAVELRGAALDDGAVGDTIPVRVRGTTIARGAVVNEKTVELEL